MKWYTPYLSDYEKPYEEASHATKEKVRFHLKKLNEVQHPTVSVVAIAHNEGRHILSCLYSLCRNITDMPYEIIVVDNLSTDNTREVLTDLGVTWYAEEKKGPGHARNCGLAHARGEYYLCIDADSIYPPYYIETMVRALDHKGVACCYALWSFIPDEGHSPFQLWIYETLRDCYLRLQNIKRPELNVRGMVFAFRTELGRQLQFRTDILRGEDGSLALAMKPYGKLKFVTNRKARILTNNNTMKAAGSIYQSFFLRVRKMLGGIGGLFRSKSEYKDEENNLIK